MGRIWIQNTLCPPQDIKTSTAEIKLPPGFPGKPTDDCPWSSGWRRSCRAAHAGGGRRPAAPRARPSPRGGQLPAPFLPPWAARATGPAPENSKHRSGSPRHPTSRQVSSTYRLPRIFHVVSSTHSICPSDVLWRPQGLLKTLLERAAEVCRISRGVKNQRQKGKYSERRVEENFRCRIFLRAPGSSPPSQVSPGLRQELAFFSSGILRDKPSERTPDTTEGNFTLINKK